MRKPTLHPDQRWKVHRTILQRQKQCRKGTATFLPRPIPPSRLQSHGETPQRSPEASPGRRPVLLLQHCPRMQGNGARGQTGDVIFIIRIAIVRRAHAQTNGKHSRVPPTWCCTLPTSTCFVLRERARETSSEAPRRRDLPARGRPSRRQSLSAAPVSPHMREHAHAVFVSGAGKVAYCCEEYGVPYRSWCGGRGRSSCLVGRPGLGCFGGDPTVPHGTVCYRRNTRRARAGWGSPTRGRRGAAGWCGAGGSACRQEQLEAGARPQGVHHRHGKSHRRGKQDGGQHNRRASHAVQREA